MKKIYFLMMAFIFAIAANVNAATVYFQNTGKWGTVYAHMWQGGTGNDTNWPGTVVSTKTTVDGVEYYYVTTTKEKIIFNAGNNQPQTKDLYATDGAVYSYEKNKNSGDGSIDPIGTIKDGKFTPAGAVELVEGHLYFPVEAPYTTSCMLHTWSPQITKNGWPGDNLTDKTTLGDGKQYWTFTVADNRELTGTPGILIQTSQDQNKYEAGALAIKDGDIIRKVGSTLQVVGNAIDGKYPDQGGTVEPDPGEDYSSWYVNVLFDDGTGNWPDNGIHPVNGISKHTDLAIGTKEFVVKIYDGAKDIHYGDQSNPIVPGDWQQLYVGGGNMKIAGATAGQKFDVEYDCATNKIKVTAQGGGGTVEPDPETPTDEVLYFVGNGSINGTALGWTPTEALAVEGKNGVYEFTATDLEQFKMSTVNKDWDSGFNAEGFCLDGEGNEHISDNQLGTDIKLYWGFAGDIYTPAKGDYKIVITIKGEKGGSLSTINVTKIGDTPVDPTPDPGEAVPEVIYLRGNGNWEDNSDAKLTLVKEGDEPKMSEDGNEYIYTGTFASIEGEFKLASDPKGWSDLVINYGDGGQGTPAIGQTLECYYNGDNFNATNKLTDVTLTFYWNPDTKQSSWLQFSGEGDEPVEPDPTPGEAPEVVYLRGDINDWGGTAMTRASETANESGEYTYTVTIDELTGEFKVADKADTWDGLTVNLGDGNETNVIGNGETHKAVNDGQNFTTGEGTTIYNAVVTLYYNPTGDSWLQVSGTPEYFIARGEYNQWGSDENAIRFEPIGGLEGGRTSYVYTATVSAINGEFKLAYNDWAINYGTQTDVEANATYAATFDGGNFKADNLSNVEMMFYFNPEAELYHLVVLAGVPETLTTRAKVEEVPMPAAEEVATTPEFINLELQKVGEQAADGSIVYSATLPEGKALAGQFNLVSDNGAINHGVDGANATVEGTGTYSLVKNGTGYLDLGNNHLTGATLTFTYQPNETMPSTLEVSGGTTTGVEDITADSVDGDAIYFNLQGVRVDNPANGVYIRVSGANATKVMRK